MASAGSVSTQGGIIVSTDFAKHAIEFFGTMPVGLSCPFKSRTYIPNNETHSCYKTGVDSMMYYTESNLLLMVIDDNTYQKAKLYFCDIDGLPHNDIGLDKTVTLEYNIYDANDLSKIGTIKSNQSVTEAL